MAYDPQKGRLWHICSGCSRWILAPLESRWETLEACEEAVQTRGRVRASSPHLSLVVLDRGELVRVGGPPRREFVDWRYGSHLPGAGRSPGFWVRLLGRLPAPPVGGYDPYRGLEGALRSEPWLASPFLEAASPLTYLFSQVPLAPVCPSCGGPLALRPWEFQRARVLNLSGAVGIEADCGLCGTSVAVELSKARPTLRMGLSLVTPRGKLQTWAEGAAGELDALGGPAPFLKALSAPRPSLGELNVEQRVGLIITLDELAEVEALEAEWRKAEELAAIMDGELSEVPGFETFRRGILGEGA